jgi:hypothetical protein
MSEVATPNTVIPGASPHSSPYKRGRSGSTSVPPLSLSPLDAELFIEPVLKPNPYRFTLFPVLKPKLFAKYKDHQSVMWIPEEIDLSKDMKDWVKLTKDEQYFIRNILGFFAGSDGIVQENLSTRFSNEVQLAEARAFYAIQNASIQSEAMKMGNVQYLTPGEATASQETIEKTIGRPWQLWSERVKKP